jgi:hypothetical protein
MSNTGSSGDMIQSPISLPGNQFSLSLIIFIPAQSSLPHANNAITDRH